VSQLNQILDSLLVLGVFGNEKDFFAWTKMEALRDSISVDWNQEQVAARLMQYQASGQVIAQKGYGIEYKLAPTSSLFRMPGENVQYQFRGDLDFAPLQYVKSRSEFFLASHGADEDTVQDLSIAILEAVENTVKYGDGHWCEAVLQMENGTFRAILMNKIRNVDLDDDISRGKFSSKATLMKGMMVMGKLFDDIDLSFEEEAGIARFQGVKKIKA
jgi:anti-sigma regulatory factor (Ser/Thr protein kinase)